MTYMNPREGNNDPSKSELVESIKRTVSSFINPKWLGGRFDKELKGGGKVHTSLQYY